MKKLFGLFFLALAYFASTPIAQATCGDGASNCFVRTAGGNWTTNTTWATTSGGGSCDPLSTEVATKAFFQTWVEGLNSAGVWERVSHRVFEWCSVSWLKRATPTANWQTTPNSKVVSDSGAMKEFAKSPDDIDI